MSDHDKYVQTAKTTPAPERTSAAVDVLGANSDRQCALEEGCDDTVPPLDAIFWDGFEDEHASLMGDIAQVTARAMELQEKMPSAEHAAILDHHIEGHFKLEEALAAAVTDAQAGTFYDDAGGLELEVDAVERVLALWDRTEVALDVLREHNGMYAAVLGQELERKLTELSSLAQTVLEAKMEERLEESERQRRETFAVFEASWAVAALSIAKIPADVAVDVAVGAGIAAAMPMVLGAVGLSGALPAVVVAGGLAYGASQVWNRASDWGPDIGTLHEGVTHLNGYLDVGSDATAIEHVEAGLRANAEAAGKVSMGLTVLLDAVAAGVAIEGYYSAAAAWEAYKREDEKMHVLWDQCALLLGNLMRFSDQLKAGVGDLADRIGEGGLAIDQLESTYDGALYEV
jgi:hypothetical protein